MSKPKSKAKLNRSTIRRVLALIRPYTGSVNSDPYPCGDHRFYHLAGPCDLRQGR